VLHSKLTSYSIPYGNTTQMALDKKMNNTILGGDNTPDLYAYLEGDDTNIMETPKKVSSREKKLIQLSGKFGELGTQA